ncbi:hypothetical protein [Streptomyces sp. NBC_00872]|uniref:hypothetical protein n=1 Tax=Streptomyces sp. NBC_00872 TaxID=2903686 RepID=UPI00386BAD91|nr:hypothetical protein OG214_00410 [Streptomyces sp. NBC_00872]
MHESENEILVDELAAVAAVTGGSGRLAGLMAKIMRNNIHEIDLVVPMPYEGAVERVVEVQERTGRRLEPRTAEPGADERTFRFVTSGGTGGMNPVVVTVLVARGGEGDSSINLRAAAKEGLIRQRAAERTATHLAALLVE